MTASKTKAESKKPTASKAKAPRTKKNTLNGYGADDIQTLEGLEAVRNCLLYTSDAADE